MPENPLLSRFYAAFAALSTQLACPACYGELCLKENQLGCSQCGRTYPIVDGIPVLIPAAPSTP